MAEPFLEQSLHPTVIIRGYVQALEDAVSIIDGLAFKIDTSKREEMLKIVSSCIGTKFASRFGNLLPVRPRFCASVLNLCHSKEAIHSAAPSVRSSSDNHIISTMYLPLPCIVKLCQNLRTLLILLSSSMPADQRRCIAATSSLLYMTIKIHLSHQGLEECSLCKTQTPKRLTSLQLSSSSRGRLLNLQELALDAVLRVMIRHEGADPEIDIKKYAKVEKLPGGSLDDCKVLDGVMFQKDVVLPGRMRRSIKKPRILLLDCPLEYKKGENQTNVELSKEEDW